MLPQVPSWEVVSVTGLQLVLCMFNLYVTWRGFAGWLRNRKAARGTAASAAAADAAGAVRSEPVALTPSQAARQTAARQYDAGMAPPTAHIAVTSNGRAWSVAAVDDVAAAKRSAQDAYGQHVQNAARQRKALERAQEAQDNASFPAVMAGSNAVVRVF